MDDTAAIKRCLEQDPEAFRYLVERYQQKALRHATAVLCNREDARDAAQEAFLEAYQSLREFDTGRPFYPWFYTILRRRCYRLLSAKSGQPSVSLEENHVESASTSDSPLQRLAVRQALAAMEAPEREILLLRHYDGFSYEELAGRLQIPVGTVMSRLFSARKKLGGYLSKGVNPCKKKN